MNEYNSKYLEKKAKKLRKKVLDLGLEHKDTHLGGSFSVIEILITLYDLILEPEDKLILSKGHCCDPMYLLLKEKGYNPEIKAHPDLDEKNGIFCTTGSLGHGLPIGAGMALARKIQKKPGNIYVILGDGECQEGSIWETLPLAAKHKLDNLVMVIDNNKLQQYDLTEDVSPMNYESIFRSFGCYTLSVNGHSFEELSSAFKEYIAEKPKAIVADTIKGKGVSFMENGVCWHAKIPNQEEINLIYKELE